MCGMWEGALSFHAFSRTATLPVPPCVHQPRSSPNSILSSGFLWRLHHTDMINYYINSFSSPSPLWRTCGEAENTKPSNLDFVFLLCHLAHSLGFYGNGVIQVQFSSLPFSHVRLFATPWTAAHQASQSITNSQSLLKLMSIKSVIPSNHLILCHPLLLLPSIFLSIWVFSNESVLCIRWPKYWSFSFSTQWWNLFIPMNTQGWFPLGLIGLISLQSKGRSRVFSNTTVQKHQFFNAQPSLWSNSSHLYMTTGKTIALTRRTFVCKVMFLLPNRLSRPVIAFLPRSKCPPL